MVFVHSIFASEQFRAAAIRQPMSLLEQFLDTAPGCVVATGIVAVVVARVPPPVLILSTRCSHDGWRSRCGLWYQWCGKTVLIGGESDSATEDYKSDDCSYPPNSMTMMLCRSIEGVCCCGRLRHWYHAEWHSPIVPMCRGETAASRTSLWFQRTKLYAAGDS